MQPPPSCIVRVRSTRVNLRRCLLRPPPTAAVATTLTPTLAVAVSSPLVVAPLMSGSGAITEPLPGPDHLAALVLVRAHLSVALHLHRLDLSSLPSRSLHDPGPDLVSDPDAVPALTGRAEPQSHLLALTGPDGEVIELTLVLGLLLLLELDHFSSHLLGALLSREGEGGVEAARIIRVMVFAARFIGSFLRISTVGLVLDFSSMPIRRWDKAEFVPNPESLVTVEPTVTYERGVANLEACPLSTIASNRRGGFDGSCRRDRRCEPG